MKWKVVIFFLSLFFIFAKTVFAVSVSSTSLPTQIFDSEDIQINVSVTVTGDGIGYIRPVFFQEGTSNYFGCVKTTCGTYYCGPDNTKYPSVRGSGSVTVTVRVDQDYSGFVDGDYQFMVRRCTSASSSSCSADSVPQAVHLSKNASSPVPLVKADDCPFPSPTPIPPTPTPTPTPSATPVPTATPTPTPMPQPENIFLNEFVACPPSGSPEWVELYNGNDSTVTLTDWSVKDDKDNKSVINGQIGAKNYGVFEVHDLNNDIDTVRLYDGAGNSVSAEYKHYDVCSSSMSWSKTSTGSWQQSFIITKGVANRFPTPVPSPTVTPTPKPTATPTPDPSVLGESTESAIPTFVVSNETAEGLATRSATKKKESPIFAIIAIVLGIISLLSLGGYLWYDWKKKQSVPDASQ